MSESGKLPPIISQRTSALVSLRNFFFLQKYKQAKQGLSSETTSPELKELELKAHMAQDPYGYLATWFEYAWPDLGLLAWAGYEWYSDLHHRFLILFALICQNGRRPDDHGVQLPLLKYARTQVVKTLDLRVAKSHPSEARRLKAVVESVSYKVLRDPRTMQVVTLVHTGDFTLGN